MEITGPDNKVISKGDIPLLIKITLHSQMYAFRGKKLHLAFYYEKVYMEKLRNILYFVVGLCFPE